jgi:hypothetical protein
MEPVGRSKLLTGKTAAESLQKAPIIRGWDGSDHPHDWMTVGCGRKLEAVKRSAYQIVSDSADLDEEWANWEDLITHELVNYLKKTKFVGYQCPGCSSIV